MRVLPRRPWKWFESKRYPDGERAWIVRLFGWTLWVGRRVRLWRTEGGR